MGDSLRSLILMATGLYYKLKGGFYRGRGLDPSMGWWWLHSSEEVGACRVVAKVGVV